MSPNDEQVLSASTNGLCAAHTQQFGHCLALSQFLVGNELEIEARGCELPPRPQMEMGFVLGAAGSRCLSGHCLVLVHSAKQHNDVMASSDEAHAECWRFGKQMFICGWGSRINANPTSASAVISVLAAANPQPPESPPATLVTPLSVTSSSSFPLLFGLPSLFVPEELVETCLR